MPRVSTAIRQAKRTLISVTTDPKLAEYYAGETGRIYEAILSKTELIKQTLEGASEYLIQLGREGFK